MKKLIPCMVFLLVLTGCRTRLNEERVVTVDGGNAKGITVDPIKNAQTINIKATAVSGTFNLYVFLAKDQTDVEAKDFLGQSSGKVLASKLKVTQAELSASIPANEAAVVMATSADGKKAEVKLKVTN